jgi:dolichol-phosphate mannosyltransferase
MKTLVIIPTYNEKENIENIIRTIFSIDSQYHLLIIDDGSPDGTAKIIKKLQSAFNNQLFIIERPSKLGLGTAYITGFKWALENNYDFIFEMDADFSHDPKDLPRLLNACKDNNYDLSIGSRYVKGGKVENWPKTRWLMSYFASIYVRVILLMNIKDTTAGFKCYKKEVLEKINLDNVQFMGYAFQIEMKYSAYRLGFKLFEVPITFKDRQLGESKMNMSIFKEAFWGVLKLRNKKFK